MPTQAERLAVLETTVPTLHADVAEIKADVKTLLAAHNRQLGFVDLGKLIWGAAGGVIVMAGQWLVNNWHRLLGHS